MATQNGLIHVRGASNLNAWKHTICWKIDFANKALNQSSKIIAVKEEKRFKTAKTNIDYAYGSSSIKFKC
jgi:hypothetical protein